MAINNVKTKLVTPLIKILYASMLFITRDNVFQANILEYRGINFNASYVLPSAKLYETRGFILFLNSRFRG
ncbi:MAG: hypothetical protein QXZ41_08240 [Ignisphaera sp.]|uniref:Uncharacterized protein n=1 Tax=Ignisphaera aggregans TaxID=334771 RepID=A0A7C4JLM3_9CREN